MSIRISDQTVGMWLVELDDRSTWLAHLAHSDGKFMLDYRFRYSRADNTVHERSAYHGELKSPLDVDDAVDRMRQVYAVVLQSTRERHGWELLRDDQGVTEFARLVNGMPGMQPTRKETTWRAMHGSHGDRGEPPPVARRRRTAPPKEKQ